MEGSPADKEFEENRENTQDIDYKKEAIMSDAELEMDQEMTQNEMDLEDHEL